MLCRDHHGFRHTGPAVAFLWSVCMDPQSCACVCVNRQIGIYISIHHEVNGYGGQAVQGYFWHRNWIARGRAWTETSRLRGMLQRELEREVGCSHSYLPPPNGNSAPGSSSSQLDFPSLRPKDRNIFLVFICSLQFEKSAFLICTCPVGSSPRNNVKMQHTSTARWDQFTMAEDLTWTASLISLLLKSVFKMFCSQRFILWKSNTILA